MGVHIYETWFKTRRGYIKEIRLGKLKLGWYCSHVFDKLPQTVKNLHFCSFDLTKCCRKGPNFNIFLAIKQSWLIKAQIFQLLTYKISDLSQKWNQHKTDYIAKSWTIWWNCCFVEFHHSINEVLLIAQLLPLVIFVRIFCEKIWEDFEKI